MNSMANRTTGGRSQGNHHCRNPLCGEKNIMEILPHIRGSCPRSEKLRNSAHHKILTMIADLFRRRHLEVYEEVHCIVVTESGNQNRRADIIILDRFKDKGPILDPTIRWETNNINQDEEVNREKRNIYMPAIPYLQHQYGITNWDVEGLWFGARGTASKRLLHFFKINMFRKEDLRTISLEIMKDTLNIIHRHLYSTNSTI